MGLEGIVSKRLAAPYRSGPVARLGQGQESRQPSDDRNRFERPTSHAPDFQRYWRPFADFGRRLGGNFHA